MDAHHVVKTNPSAFKSDLDDLIADAVHSSPSTSHFSAIDSPLAAHSPPAKRVKRERDSENAHDDDPPSNYNNPTRKQLLERQDAAHLRNIFLGDGVVKAKEPLSKTGAKAVALSHRPTQPASPTRFDKARSTIPDVVRRQWDTSKAKIAYEDLLQTRRREKLRKVDRYIPSYRTLNTPPTPIHAKPTFFPLGRLPEGIQRKIFRLLLAKEDPIVIDLSWLRPFVRGHARVPSATQALQHQDATYNLPVPWTQLRHDSNLMRRDMIQFKEALEVRGMKTRGSRSPCAGLSTTPLRVSRNIHRVAADVFYSENVFRFSCATSAWMTLDSFLATIGAKNVERIKHISIHVPLWHRGMQEDHIEGAIVDLLSPASRMAVIHPPAHDRLLSAILHSTSALLQPSNLVSLSLEMENGLAADYWAGRHSNDRRLITLTEAEEAVTRKQAGTACLKELSEMLAAKGNSPVVRLYHQSKSAPMDVYEFRRRLPALLQEAKKYGWHVGSYLKDARSP